MLIQLKCEIQREALCVAFDGTIELLRLHSVDACAGTVDDDGRIPDLVDTDVLRNGWARFSHIRLTG